MILPASSQRAALRARAVDMVRLVNRDTGAFLHLSGQGETEDIAWSWLGFRHQAAALRAAATERGEPWPFEPVHRSRFEDGWP